MKKPRVAAVKYSNTFPLVWGLVHGEQKECFDLSFVTPAACADALGGGEADIGLIPAIEYHRIPDLSIVRGISIASKQAARSVLLLSNKPVREVETVAADNSSRSSVALLRILFAKFYSRKVKLVPSPPNIEAMLAQADAALIVGDPALTYQGGCAATYDLGSEWRRFTGLPFVFAFWAGRGDLDWPRHRQALELSKEYGMARLDQIVTSEAPKLGFEIEAFRDYLSVNLNYTLDEENLSGLRLFYRLAAELGIIEQEKELNFV